MRIIYEDSIEGRRFVVIMGTSSETKPTGEFCQGSVFFETDNKRAVYYDESNGWEE